MMKIEIKTTRFIKEEQLPLYFELLKNYMPNEFIETLKKDHECRFITENDDEFAQTEYKIKKLKG
jgi:hypothetical protein